MIAIIWLICNLIHFTNANYYENQLNLCLESITSTYYLDNTVAIWYTDRNHYQYYFKPRDKDRNIFSFNSSELMLLHDVNISSYLRRSLKTFFIKTQYFMFDTYQTCSRSMMPSKLLQADNVLWFVDLQNVTNIFNNLFNQKKKNCPFLINGYLSPKAKITIVSLSNNLSLGLQFVKRLWDELRLLNVILMVPTNNQVHVHSYFPYECQPNKHYQLTNIWNNNFLYNTSLFPDKTKNSCQFIGIQNYLQYYGGESECYGNLHRHILMLISRHLNITITETAQYADIAFDVPTSVVFSLGQDLPLYQEKALVILTHTRQKIPQWRNIIRPFTSATWIASAVTLLFIFVTLCLIGKIHKDEYYYFQSTSYCLLHSVGLYLMNGLTDRYQTNVMKCFIGLVLLYTLIITTAYTSSIVKLLTKTSYYPHYQSIKQMMDTGFNFTCPPDVFFSLNSYSLNNSQIHLLMNNIFYFLEETDDIYNVSFVVQSVLNEEKVAAVENLMNVLNYPVNSLRNIEQQQFVSTEH